MSNDDIQHDAKLIITGKRITALYHEGQFQMALALSEGLLTEFTKSAPLFSLAGAAAQSLGMLQKAEEYCQEAIALNPVYPLAHNILGLTLKAAGRYQEAEDSLRRALEIAPDWADAWVNLGNLYSNMELGNKAEEAYKSALVYFPDHVDAVFNLGLLLVKQNRLLEAEVQFKSALRAKPKEARLYNELGNIFIDQLRFSEAEEAYKRALALQPDSTDAYYNLGVLLKETQRNPEAMICIQQALAIKPDHASSLNLLGNILVDSGRKIEAEEAYRRALEVNTDSAIIYNNLGNLLMSSGRFREAETAFRKAIAQQPDYGNALGQAVTCANKRYSWGARLEDDDVIVKALNEGVVGIPTLMVLSLSRTNPEQHRKAAWLSAINKLKPYLGMPPLVDPGLHRQNGRLRIGYLSADFRDHAVMHLLAGVLKRHDRNRYEIHGYSYGRSVHNLYKKIFEDAGGNFHDFSRLDDFASARRIVEDEIDILIDLTGHTGEARPAITALRPAPVIVNWLGFPGTLGIPRLADYIIGDPLLTPLEFAEHYSETLAWMPHCYQPNDDELKVGEKPTRREVGLPDEALVFCSFNQSYKLTPETFSVWCRLLAEVEGSVLWLLEPKDKEAVRNLQKEAVKRGVDPERLLWAAHVPMSEHLARLQLADVALDSFPYGSGATGSNVLRAGVPLVTLLGDAYVSRMAASQLHAMGVPELVAESWEEYFRLAKQLATKPEMRQAIRDKLVERRDTSPLFDTQRFTRDLEALYDKIWDQHARGVREPITQ